jgi:hypothetical protein
MSDSIEQLRTLFTEHPAGQAATRPLRKGTRVGLRIHGEPQSYVFERVSEGTRITSGALEQTDFDLILGAQAVREICQTTGTGVGDFGVAFLRSLLRETDDQRVEVKLHSGFFDLTKNGYLKVLVMGGPKVLGFLAKEGYIGPRGIAKAIRRLRKT